MSILNRYNNKPLFEYDNTKERSYINLKELVNENGIKKTYEVHALFINTKSRFGDAPIIVTDEYMVNAPQHLLSTVQEMMNDTELIEMVNKRQVGFTIYEYEGKNGRGYSVEWVQQK